MAHYLQGLADVDGLAGGLVEDDGEKAEGRWLT